MATNNAVNNHLSVPTFKARLANAGIANVTGDGTTYTVICDQVEYDNFAGYNNGTGIYTVPVTGAYIVGGNVCWNSLGAGHTRATVDVLLTGTGQPANPVYINPVASAVGGAILTNPFATIIILTAGDTMKLSTTVFNSTKTVGLQGDYTLFWAALLF
jgi:hypothetical protein